jgi:hypothetical protein
MRSFYVYTFKADDDALPFYVGKGTSTRAKDHLAICQRPASCSRFHRKLKSMLDADLSPCIEIVADGLSENEALQLEIELIGKYGRLGIDDGGILLNVLEGGDNPPNHKGRKFAGRKPPSTKGRSGRVWTEADRQRHSQIMLSRMKDPETREKCSAAKRGRPIKLSDESRAKIAAAIRGSKNPKGSEAKLGARNPMFGRKWFNDGERSSLFHPEEAPEGWLPGKARRKSFA